jgi:hypothetical protein
MMIQAICLVVMLFTVPPTPRISMSKVSYRHQADLKKWVGHYPSEQIGKDSTDFFNVPEVKESLKRILKPPDLALLTTTLTVENPIYRVDGYLAIERCRPCKFPRSFPHLIFILFPPPAADSTSVLAFFTMHSNFPISHPVVLNQKIRNSDNIISSLFPMALVEFSNLKIRFRKKHSLMICDFDHGHAAIVRPVS